ncbi:MAG TPA: histidine phosphatase family protein [Ktedonobacterales bacterium]
MAGMATTPATTTRFVLARHGEAQGNREMRYLGTTDVPLTPRGEAQARQLAEAVRPFRPGALYSSALRRARATAEEIGALLHLDVVVSDDLREQDFGVWEDRSRAEVQASDPERLAAWEAGADVAPPAGESLAATRERVVACADLLAARHPGETVVLASHVGPIKALVCVALTLPASGAHRMWLDPASICVIDWNRSPDTSSGILRVFNAIAHLDPPVRWLG